MKNYSFAIAAAIIILLITLSSSIFVVPEGQQALITQFGRIVGEPITKAGLHTKLPFVQDVRMFEKRMLTWDGDENRDGIPTKDKKTIIVDAAARWKIADVVKFANAVRSEETAMLRLDTVIDGKARDVISSHNLVEAVRNTNQILDLVEERKKQIKDEESQVEDEVVGEIERISVGREQLSQMILESARKELAGLGIELIDVQLRGIAYNEEVKTKVYDRMISERKRVAERFRSLGQGEAQRINGKLNRDLKQIESEAYREAQTIRGKAEAEAFKIYAGVMGQDPSFFEFNRKLEAYKKSFAGKGEFILSTDSEFLNLLDNAR